MFKSQLSYGNLPPPIFFQIIHHKLDLPTTQDSSHHQDHYILSRESLWTFIIHCYWMGG